MTHPPSSPGIAAVAQALIDARAGGTPAEVAELVAALGNAEEAYAVQDRVAVACGWQRGEVVARCWKSGGASREATLTHAPLPASGVWQSPADATQHPKHLRLIEAEIALRLAVDVDAAQAAALDAETARAVVDAMCVSIELVDSRWDQGIAAPALLKLADQQSHGGLVLGAWQPFAPRDWMAQACEVHIGNAPPQVFRGTHAFGDPVWGVPGWLRHVTRDGRTAPAGTVVTTGTWCGALEVPEGAEVAVVFEGIGSARVRM